MKEPYSQAHWRGGRREQALLLPFSWGSKGRKSALFKHAMICFLIVNMIQQGLVFSNQILLAFSLKQAIFDWKRQSFI